jgi:hypothetical protein
VDHYDEERDFYPSIPGGYAKYGVFDRRVGFADDLDVNRRDLAGTKVTVKFRNCDDKVPYDNDFEECGSLRESCYGETISCRRDNMETAQIWHDLFQCRGTCISQHINCDTCVATSLARERRFDEDKEDHVMVASSSTDVQAHD